MGFAFDSCREMGRGGSKVGCVGGGVVFFRLFCFYFVLFSFCYFDFCCNEYFFFFSTFELRIRTTYTEEDNLEEDSHIIEED